MRLHLRSDKFLRAQNMPFLTVPHDKEYSEMYNGKRVPDAPAPPQQIMSIEQMNRQIEHGRTFTSPDGYPVIIPDHEGITEKIETDPYYQGKITERSGVLGQGSRWFKHNEREAMWNTQKALPDMRYVASYTDPAQSKPDSYKTQPPTPHVPQALMKTGSRFINGVSYIPKGKIIKEQPAVVLFSNDPRVVTLDQVESDERDPKHNTVANSLAYTSLSNRSRASVLAVDNQLLRSRKTWNRNQRFRLIQSRGEYGEAIPGMSWNDKQPDVLNPFGTPVDVAGHHKKVMEVGIVKNMRKGGMSKIPIKSDVKMSMRQNAIPHHHPNN